MFKILNIQSVSYVSQRPVGCIEKHVRTCVILWSYPFPFQYSPERFGNVQMWGVWREEEEEETSFLPYRPDFFNPSVSVYCCIVKHHKGLLVDAEGEVIKEADDFVRRHSICRGESFVLVITGYHPEDVESGNPLGRDKHVLSIQLPPVWHIAFRTGMAFVGIVERNAPFTCLTFKFLQLLGLVLVELRRGYSPWAFPYTLISCANADKKRLKVISLASLPVACSQAAFALLTHCLSSSIARRTASSSEASMIGLRPRPGRVFSPSMPSSLYRFTHAFTETKLISVCAPAFAAESPSAFRRTARQRIRKQCFSPKRNPRSSSRRCVSVNSNTFGFPITMNRTGIPYICFV